MFIEQVILAFNNAYFDDSQGGWDTDQDTGLK